MIDALAEGLLGRHVVGRARQDPGLRQPVTRIHHLSEPEICDACDAGAIEENIRRLDVPVHHAVRMRVVEGGRDLSEQLHGLEWRKPSLFEKHTQVVPCEQPHAHPGDTRFDPAGVDRHDVRVLEPGDQPRFRFKTAGRGVIPQELGWQDLQRHGSFKSRVQRLVHGGHAAAAEWPTDEEGAEGRPWRQRVGRLVLGEGICQRIGQRGTEQTRRTESPSNGLVRPRGTTLAAR